MHPVHFKELWKHSQYLKRDRGEACDALEANKKFVDCYSKPASYTCRRKSSLISDPFFHLVPKKLRFKITFALLRIIVN